MADGAARDGFDAQVERVAALGEPVRRALYRFVVSQDDAVSREQAAAAVGVARHVAKFHLDRLVTDGLLEVEYRRPPGRRGPGAGRPAKLYRRGGPDIAVTIPERHYELLGHVLAEAVAVSMRDGVPLPEALRAAARSAGRAIGAQALRSGEPVDDDALGALGAVLAQHGFEPGVRGTLMVLANCPFHSVAASQTAVVCEVNRHLVDGVVEALGLNTLTACLDPAPGRCCVTVTATT